MELQTVWFVVIAVLWIVYLLLEGFDLGVGMHMLVTARGDRERRLMLNTVGPVWDGNEVWLITAGAATFAAFPDWYASLFSGLYLPLLVVLVGLIVRAVAIEFRPDGVHDVRVRLAEHAGEVHVSVHSADPVVTQDLREGVTGLAATLAQAGYDARAWTPDQGQKQQQPREERAAKRDKRATDTRFEGALEEVSQ